MTNLSDLEIAITVKRDALVLVMTTEMLKCLTYEQIASVGILT